MYCRWGWAWRQCRVQSPAAVKPRPRGRPPLPGAGGCRHDCPAGEPRSRPQSPVPLRVHTARQRWLPTRPPRAKSSTHPSFAPRRGAHPGAVRELRSGRCLCCVESVLCAAAVHPHHGPRSHPAVTECFRTTAGGPAGASGSGSNAGANAGALCPCWLPGVNIILAGRVREGWKDGAHVSAGRAGRAPAPCSSASWKSRGHPPRTAFPLTCLGTCRKWYSRTS